MGLPSHTTTTDKALCPLRTITTFVTLDPDRTTWPATILRCARFLSEVSNACRAQGHEVQSVRVVTNPFGEYLDLASIDTAREGLTHLGSLLKASELPGVRIRFAIGEARTVQEMALLPALIREFGDLGNACVNVEADALGIPLDEVVRRAAEVVREISETTPRGEGNFNFTVNFNCGSLIPYFPASYHRKELGDCFVLGMESPDLLVRALQEVATERAAAGNLNGSYEIAHRALTSALQHHVTNLVSIVQPFHGLHGFKFAGLDSSAAPSKNCASMVDVYRLLGVAYFGAAGTVEASSLLTKVFRSVTGAPLVGFSGLMLAVTEDLGLAEATQRGEFDIRSLLTYSAVCGIGLDTVPIPGDTPLEKICALMRDTGVMAYRLGKPLTVRLFPVPGLKAGEVTAFESGDLCNCAVLQVP